MKVSVNLSMRTSILELYFIQNILHTFQNVNKQIHSYRRRYRPQAFHDPVFGYFTPNAYFADCSQRRMMGGPGPGPSLRVKECRQWSDSILCELFFCAIGKQIIALTTVDTKSLTYHRYKCITHNSAGPGIWTRLQSGVGEVSRLIWVIGVINMKKTPRCFYGLLGEVEQWLNQIWLLTASQFENHGVFIPWWYACVIPLL